MNCLECQTNGRFRTWYRNTLDSGVSGGYCRDREPYWTEASAVGSQQWLEGVGDRLPRNSYEAETPLAPLPDLRDFRASLHVTGSLTDSLLEMRDEERA